MYRCVQGEIIAARATSRRRLKRGAILDHMIIAVIVIVLKLSANPKVESGQRCVNARLLNSNHTACSAACNRHALGTKKPISVTKQHGFDERRPKN